MKKTILALSLSTTIFSLNTLNIFANEVVEISTNKYVKTLKSYIKKDEFIKIEEHPNLIFNPIAQLKVARKGLQIGYLEPTIEDVEHNIEIANKLKYFLEFNSTENEDINSISDEMIVILDELQSDLSNILVEYTNQLGFETTDNEKIVNLQGEADYFDIDDKVYAYDYLSKINSRIEKLEKMYKYIKDIS